LYDLASQAEGCPGFSRDDYAEVIEEEGEWWHVKLLKTNEEGYVPASFWTQENVPEPSETDYNNSNVKTEDSLDEGTKQAKAMYDFVPPKPDGFVPMSENEIVTIIQGDSSDEWWLAKNKDGLQGYIPANYVEVVQQ